MPTQKSTASLQISETLQEQRSQSIDAICPSHGAYVATVTTYDFGFDKPMTHTSGCPSCAAEAKAKKAADEAARKAGERHDKVATLIRRSFIPARFLDRSFDGYVAADRGQKIALGVCRAYAEKWPERFQDGGSLVLTGGPGTGKTHLACAIGNAVMEAHLASALFVPVSVMLRSIKETYRKNSDRSEQQAINDFCEPDLLILDEVGVQVGSEHEKLLMFEVLNERYQNMLPTILISNLPPDELEAFLGQRVMDRYRECGSVIAFNWASHRGQR